MLPIDAEYFSRDVENVFTRFCRTSTVVSHDRSDLSYACVGSGKDNLKFLDPADHFQIRSPVLKDVFDTYEFGYNCELCIYSWKIDRVPAA